MSLSGFLDLVESDPDTDAYCVEHPTPAALSALIPPPEYCSLNDPTDVVSLMFVAHPHNSAHLHFDADQRSVLMYQAFGVKRYVVIHPRQVRKMDAIVDPNIQRTSSLLLQNFTDEDLTAFLRYTDAWDSLLYPGETLLMPMMAWHYIEYIDTSMSVSYRLGRNRFNRFLAEQVPIPSIYLQALAVRFSDGEGAERRYADAYARIERSCRATNGDPAARAQALDRLCLALFDELYEEPERRPYSVHDLERRGLARGETPHRRRDREPGTASAPPEAIAWAESDRVALAEDVRVLSPIHDQDRAGSEVFFARGAALETRLPLDRGKAWVHGVLRRLSQPGIGPTVAELAGTAEVGTGEVLVVLDQLHGARLVVPG
jgi:hypothetical protein